MKSRRRKQAEAEWLNIIEQWRASGMSIRRYCREHGLRESRFYWWRKELAGNDCKPSHAINAAIEFLPLRIKETQMADSGKSASIGGQRIDIFLPNGSMLRVNGDISEDKLSAIVQMVAGASC
jgi:transposase-like protein